MERHDYPHQEFQWASTIKILISVLVWYKVDIIIAISNCNLFSSWYSWKIAELAIKNNHSIYCIDDVMLSQYKSKKCWFLYFQNGQIGVSYVFDMFLANKYWQVKKWPKSQKLCVKILIVKSSLAEDPEVEIIFSMMYCKM